MNSLYIAYMMLRRTLLQKKGLLMYLLIPVAAVSVIIGVLGQEPERAVSVQYINRDEGPLGGHIIQELASMSDYRLIKADSEDAMREQVITQRADAAILIPSGFSDALYKDGNGDIELLQLNVTEATFTLQIHMNTAVERLQQIIAAGRGTGLTGEALYAGTADAVAQAEKHQISAQITDYDLYVNPALSTVIGFMLMFMMGLVGNSVSTIMEDRRQMTMARVFTAPVRAIEIAAGNFLGSFLVGSLQILFVLLFTRYVAQFDYRIPFFSHWIMLEFFLLASMGIAMAIAGLTKNATTLGIINSLVITPTCMLGGCFWPISIMPEWMQKLANFVPQKWAIDALQRMAAGESLERMGLHMAVLALFALILLGVGSAVLKPAELERE